MSKQPELIPDTGAAAALRAIEADEAKARARCEECEKVYLQACKDAIEQPADKDGTDYKAIEDAALRQLEAARKWLNEIRRMLITYDKNIDPVKRDNTEKMTREEVENFLRMLVIYIRGANETTLNRFCHDVLSAKKEADVYSLISELHRENIISAFEMAQREAHLPPFALSCIKNII